MEYQEIINFWFEEVEPSQWFEKDDQLDEEIRQRFGACHQQATQGELAEWRDSLKGRLAEIIVLDQFSRNIFRNDPRSFAYDGMALVLAQEAIKQEELNQLSTAQRSFLYMPLMHSESLVIHEEALRRFSEKGLETNLEFEIKHRDILMKFGRYPHRNDILNRQSTPEELRFLKEPNSSF